MFVRSKRSGQYEYLQVVHNERHDGRVQQRVVATLGRLDVLRESGQLDALLASCARFAEHSAVLSAQRQGRVSAAGKVRIGPPLVFQRLWEELGLPKVLGRLLDERKFGFDAERAIFLTVLHRLFAPGSDRAAEVRRERYAIAGADGLQLHHLYRAMAWLGEPLPEGQQAYATPFAPRCVKDLIEEALFAQTRGLFTSLELVFFDTTSICIVADRGMISKDTIAKLQAVHRDVRYILGARLRAVKEIYEQVLSRPGRYREVYGPKQTSKDPSPLKVKEVWVADRRYVVCYNEDQAKKDAGDREAILAGLRDRLRQGAVALVGNKGYRKFLRTRAGGGFEIDEAKVAWEARFDGKWVLRTDTDLSPADCALRYKDLWMVEQSFRSCKSVLQTRPIYHRCDETIRGHVFCSFLALMLLKELLGRIERRGWKVEWERLRDDLDALEEITIHTAGRSFVVRSATEGVAGKAIQAAGVALGSAVRLLDDGPPLPPAGKRARSAKAVPC